MTKPADRRQVLDTLDLLLAEENPCTVSFTMPIRFVHEIRAALADPVPPSPQTEKAEEGGDVA